jgi:hypothetical protein
MDPRLQAIVEANARLVRFTAEVVASKAEGDGEEGRKPPELAGAAGQELQADLDEQCRRLLSGLGACASPEFLRYLLRNMDLAERVAILEAARETDAFVAKLGGCRAPTITLRSPSFYATQLPAVLAQLGGATQ